LLAFDLNGDLLDASGFPIALPDGVTASGGFAIADIDRDSKVEVVFGSSDGKLHCWALVLLVMHHGHSSSIPFTNSC